MDDERLFRLRHEAAHLAAAGRTAQLRALLLNLDWMRRKLADLGYPDLDADLALLDTDPEVRGVREALRRSADLLAPMRPANALKMTLLSRLPAGGVREAVLAGVPADRLMPRLDPLWPPARATRPIAQAIPGDAEVTALVSFPDGRRLLRGDQWGGAEVFDVTLGELVTSLATGGPGIIAAAISPDGLRVVLADSEGELRQWTFDPAKGLPTGPPESREPGGVVSCAFFPSGRRLATVTVDGIAMIWDAALRRLATLEPPAPRGGSYRDVGPVCVAPGEDWLAAQVLGDGNGAYAWDTATGRLLQHRDDLGIIGAAADDRVLAVHRGDVVGWHPPTGRITGVIAPGFLARGLVERIRWHTSRNRSAWTSHRAADPAGSWVARVDQLELSRGQAVSLGATVRLRDLARNADHELRLGGRVGTTVTGPGGAWLAIGSDAGHADGAVHLWRPGNEPVLLGEHSGPVTLGAAGGRGDWLATADRHGTTRLWPIAAPAPDGRPAELAKAMTVCGSPGAGDWFVAVDTERKAYVVVAGRVRHRLAGRERITFNTGQVITCVVAPDGTWLATGDDDGTISFWDPVTGARGRRPGQGHSGQVVAADGSATWLATVDWSGDVLCWTPFADRPRWRVALGATGGRLCRADPAGEWLAVDGAAGELHLLFPGTADEHRVVRLPDRASALAVRGAQLLVGDVAGGVHLVDPRDRRARLIHRAPAPVQHLACALEPDWIACVAQSDDDRDTSAQLHLLRGDGPATVIDRNVEKVTACRPSPDGRLLATVSAQRTLRIWDPVAGRAVTGLRVDGALTDVTWPHPRGTVAAVGSSGVELFRLVT